MVLRCVWVLVVASLLSVAHADEPKAKPEGEPAAPNFADVHGKWLKVDGAISVIA